MTEVPVIVLSGLTKTQKRTLRLADNKIALQSGWDIDVLKIELGELSLEPIDLSLTGFSIGEIDKVLSDPVDPAEDAIPAARKVAVSLAGDIWTIGAHRVACGDCRDAALMARLVAGHAVDCAFLDAPYNVAIKGHAGGKGRVKHREFVMAAGEMTPAEFTAFLTEALGLCARLSRDGAVHFVCMDHHHVGELIAAGEAVYGARLNIAVWNKSNAGMGTLYRSKHELVFIFKVGDAPHTNAVQLGKHGRNRTNVWDYASVNTFGGRAGDLALHPTVKPMALVRDAIMDVTRRGQTVLDVFLGSGTTLIAAERCGRVCFGADIDPLYVDLAMDRFSALFGEEAILEETGETFAAVMARRAAEGGEG